MTSPVCGSRPVNMPVDRGRALAMSPDQTSPSMTKISSGQKCPDGCSFDVHSSSPSLTERATSERFCPEKRTTSLYITIDGDQPVGISELHLTGVRHSSLPVPCSMHTTAPPSWNTTRSPSAASDIGRILLSTVQMTSLVRALTAISSSTVSSHPHRLLARSRSLQQSAFSC